MIKIPNSDSTIWENNRVILDIVQDILSTKQPITITTNGEGPCAQSLGLYTLLDDICKRFEFPKNQIIIHTCNLVERHDDYMISINPQMKYLNSAKQYASQVDYTKKFTENFRCFGNFIGHGNLHRLHLASYLRSKYSEQTYQTYHCNILDDYHRPFIAIDEMMAKNYSWDLIDMAIELIKQSPLKLDKIESYPILDPTTLNICKMYNDFFVEIVCLTYFTGNTFYLDEKIWRPIIMRTPFIVQGPRNFLQRFRSLGFKTFEKYWCEGYSEDPADFQPKLIIENIDVLAKKTVGELESLYIDMQQDLEHNYNHLMNLTEKDFLRVQQ